MRTARFLRNSSKAAVDGRNLTCSGLLAGPSLYVHIQTCMFLCVAVQHTARLKQQEASMLSCGAQPKVEQDLVCVYVFVCVCA